ncbi:MAG: hypothetical protein FWC90_02725 [Oscillospiraceae bacterium]|nr:hypothetical protein [Oscillospiraceae bacterium]
MASFEDLKRKAKGAVETIADVSVEAYRLAEEKAKILAKTTKLNAEISREKTQIRRLYCEIGRMYYELCKDNPEENFVQNFTEVAGAYERIAEMKKEVEALKKTSGFQHDDFADADFNAEPGDDESQGDA